MTALRTLRGGEGDGPLNWRASAFGLNWRSDIPLGQFWPADDEAAAADVSVRVCHDQPPPRQQLVKLGAGTVFDDGYRIEAETEATFDVFGAGLIEARPGADWSDDLPAHFYSTVLSVILAARGMTPIHGTAAGFADGAILACGPSGAGKSSLGAAFVALGGDLISDDLSAFEAWRDGEPSKLLAGRPDIRLFSGATAMLQGAMVMGPALRGKQRIRLARAKPPARSPVSAIVLLDPRAASVTPVEPVPAKARILARQMFRPWLMRALPGHSERLRTLLGVASRTLLLRAPAVDPRDSAAMLDQAKRIMETALG